MSDHAHLDPDEMDVLDALGEGITIHDAEGEIVGLNRAAQRILGLEEAELASRNYRSPDWRITDLEGSPLAPDELPAARALEDGQAVWNERIVVERPDDAPVVVSVNAVPIRGEDGRVEKAVVSFRDVTEQQATERRVELSERRYRELFEHNVAGAFRARTDGTIEECNPAFASIFGFADPAELEGRDAAELYPSREVRDAYVERLREAGELVNEEMRLHRRDGSPVWVLENSVLTEDPETGETVIQGTLVDITERKRAEKQLRHQALHDPLTGLANRALLADRLEQGLARARRHGSALGLLMLDVDHFKRVNDRLGHAAGDRVLTELARRLRETVREEDTVARWGGDEFVVVLPDLERIEATAEVRERIREAIRSPIPAGGERVQVDVTVGAVVRSESGGPGTVPTGDPEELIRFGSLALHDAKEESPAGFRLFDPDEEVAGAGRIRRERELRDAIEEGQIEPRYQPIVRLEDGATVGFETLARWRHPERGLLPPSEFVPLAEELGLIVGIDEVLVRRGCREVAAWREGRSAELAVPVSFNLSGQHFKDPEVADELVRWTEEAGMRPEGVVVEVTETSLLQVPVRIAEIRERGFRVFVDDFGTGYSTFTYLRDLRVDGLKVDLTFVQGIAERDTDAALVETMLTLGDRLGLTVIAEGIETEDQAAKLRELGCELGQGFLFARPMRGTELAEAGP